MGSPLLGRVTMEHSNGGGLVRSHGVGRVTPNNYRHDVLRTMVMA